MSSVVSGFCTCNSFEYHVCIYASCLYLCITNLQKKTASQCQTLRHILHFSLEKVSEWDNMVCFRHQGSLQLSLNKSISGDSEHCSLPCARWPKQHVCWCLFCSAASRLWVRPAAADVDAQLWVCHTWVSLHFCSSLNASGTNEAPANICSTAQHHRRNVGWIH